MPTISTFMGITITMYFDDHTPPHFHARAAEHNAKVRIDVLEAIESDLRRRELRLVLAWADRSREHSPSARIPVSANIPRSCTRTGVARAKVSHCK